MVFLASFNARPFEIRCSCGGSWVRKDWGSSRRGFWYRCIEERDVVVYACDKMQEHYGRGVRHRPVHWQVRCQDRDCFQGKPVVLHSEEICLLPGLMGFDDRRSEFYQENEYNYRAYICPHCAERAWKKAEEARRRNEYRRLVTDSVPSRPALRFQDIARECRQKFKKSVKGRRGVGRQAQDAFYSHVVYGDNLHERRIETLESALKGLKRRYPEDEDIQSMRYAFFWAPAGDGLSIHSLSVEFPLRDFSLTIVV